MQTKIKINKKQPLDNFFFFLKNAVKPRGESGGAKLPRQLPGNHLQACPDYQLTWQCRPRGNSGVSLALIVLAAKETLEEFANRLCIHGRQGSTRVPNGDKSDPGALWEHYHYRPCSALLSVSAFFLKKKKKKRRLPSPFQSFLPIM